MSEKFEQASNQEKNVIKDDLVKLGMEFDNFNDPKEAYEKLVELNDKFNAFRKKHNSAEIHQLEEIGFKMYSKIRGFEIGVKDYYKENSGKADENDVAEFIRHIGNELIALAEK